VDRLDLADEPAVAAPELDPVYHDALEIERTLCDQADVDLAPRQRRHAGAGILVRLVPPLDRATDARQLQLLRGGHVHAKLAPL
jgi:hypothetical protein